MKNTHLALHEIFDKFSQQQIYLPLKLDLPKKKER